MSDNKNKTSLLNFENIPSGNDTGKIDNDGVYAESSAASFTETQDVSAALNRLRGQNAIKEELEYLTRTCKNEQELLNLRNRIIDKEYPNLNKRDLLIALDRYVSQQLSATIHEASLLNSRKKEVGSLKLGMVLMIVIGFFLTSIFVFSFPIAVVLAILGWCGSDDRKNYKASVEASAIVQRYRNAGYQLEVQS